MACPHAALKRPETWATIFLALTLFLMTLWRFGANQCLILFVLVVLCAPTLRQRLFKRAYLLQPKYIAIYLFLAWALITVSYSQASPVWHALDGFKAYAKLLLFLLIPVAIRSSSVSITSPGASIASPGVILANAGVQSNCPLHYWLEQALILGVLINVILSTLYFFQIFAPHLQPHISMNATFEINPLQLIFVVAIALWILATRFFERRFAWHDIVIFVILTIYLWGINIERSGYLLFLALALVLAWQYGHQKWFALVACALPIFCIALYFAVPQLKARVDLGVQNVEAFSQVSNVTEIGVNNSLGLRLAFAAESFQEIKLHPLLGTGLGSFKTVYDQKYNPDPRQVQINDPHNAYTYVAFELGLIGLALYLYCLYRLFPHTHHANGIWWAFMVMGLVDSGLVLNAVALSFIVLAALSFTPGDI